MYLGFDVQDSSALAVAVDADGRLLARAAHSGADALAATLAARADVESGRSTAAIGLAVHDRTAEAAPSSAAWYGASSRATVNAWPTWQAAPSPPSASSRYSPPRVIATAWPSPWSATPRNTSAWRWRTSSPFSIPTWWCSAASWRSH